MELFAADGIQTRLRRMKALVAALLSFGLLACRASPAASAANCRIVRTSDGVDVELEQMLQVLAEADVVFLGEEHDNDVAHALQLKTTAGLLELRGELALSLEMFERDTQAGLDRYLRGELTEAQFLSQARPWSNYQEHYAAAVRLMRERGMDVIAANVPRPLASRVSKQGLASAQEEAFMPMRVDIDRGEYFQRFEAIMGSMGGQKNEQGLALWYAAQCVKDDAMAQSICHWIGARGIDPPLVVHWCGKFHSDYGLGTVERLRWRAPDLKLRVVSTISTPDLRRELTQDEHKRGDFVWLVPSQAPVPAAAAR